MNTKANGNHSVDNAHDQDLSAFDEYAGMGDDGVEGDEPADTQKVFTHRSMFMSKAIFRGFRVMPNDAGVVADLALMSGQGDGKQRFLNGSFMISKSLLPLAKKIGTLNFDVRVEVEIGNLHCVPSLDRDDGTKIYANYRGFLNKMSFG